MTRHSFPRRQLNQGLACAALLATPGFSLGQSLSQLPAVPQRHWYDAALAMKRLAESWGDQPYGAVLVLGEKIVGEGPSRVVKLGDPSAHAEREAMRDAQRRLGAGALSSSVLYSTSRPCALCEAAAAQAGVARMIFGQALIDAGRPAP
jgi:tRNA(Arg) A34 adenosine deaminase TadA